MTGDGTAPAPRSPVGLHKALTEIWKTGPGIQRLAAVNHSVVGKRFLVTSVVFFGIGGLLAMMIRAQLATSQSAFVGPEIYNQLFTMHGTVMMFLFAIPMIEGLALYLLPKMLGARDMAFPRLSAYGYWCYLFGGAILIVAMIAGFAPDGGWFMYAPLSSGIYTPGINPDVWLLGVTFVEISAITIAIEIIVTILKMRAPGMSLNRMPIFAWYMLVTAFMMALGFPPLIVGSILLELERAFDLPFFDPTRGGDPLLWQHLFWLFGHPEVYIIFLPAAGAISTMIPVFARHELIGYRAVVVAVIATGFLSFGLWVHHMFTVGIPHLALAFFSAASALVAIPTGVQVFAWLATLAHGRPRMTVPMLYIVGFLVVFVAGGLTGVMLAMVPFNLQAHDTHFVVAHLHYVLVGGFVFPLIAAAYYWMPHFTGREALHRLSVPAFWLIFVGFNMTFLLMHLTGLKGMPRRVATYPDSFGWESLNLLSSVGGFVMAIGFALVLADMILHVRYGHRARRNIWGAHTLDWAQPTPIPPYNFAAIPKLDERADRLDPARLGPALAAGRGYLGFARHGRLETLGVEMATGRAEQLILLPGPTYVPLWAAAATCSFVLAVLFREYWAVVPSLIATVGLLFAWAWASGSRKDMGPQAIGQDEHALPHVEAHGPPSYWAMVFGLVANGALFASLLFSPLFLWVSAPGWPPETIVAANGALPSGAALLLLAAMIAGHGAVRANARGGHPAVWLGMAALWHLAAMAAFAALASRVPEPTGHAHAATIFVALGYAALHTAVAALIAVFGFWRCRAGYVSPVRSLDLRIGCLWHDYTALVGLTCLALLFAMPQLASYGR